MLLEFGYQVIISNKIKFFKNKPEKLLIKFFLNTSVMVQTSNTSTMYETNMKYKKFLRIVQKIINYFLLFSAFFLEVEL